MAGLKRDPIKHVRDRAKSRYNKGTECEICGSQENLDFHHYYSMTEMLDKWLKKKRYPSSTDEEVLAFRDEFIAEHEYEIFEATVTLCHHHHHTGLHGVYGKSPNLGTAKKQMNWVRIQKEKHSSGMV
jgi:hypothetical protein